MGYILKSCAIDSGNNRISMGNIFTESELDMLVSSLEFRDMDHFVVNTGSSTSVFQLRGHEIKLFTKLECNVMM
jgi:hypothetical protein